MATQWVPRRKDFRISCFETLLFLVEVILPGLCAYVLTAIQVSEVIECGSLFSPAVAGAGVSSGLARLLFSDAFSLILVHAVLTQVYSTMLVISFATLYHTGHFRARAKAVLEGLRKRTVPAIFFFSMAVATVGSYVAVIPVAFRLLDVLGKLRKLWMLLGGAAVYLAATVCVVVVCRLAYEDASDRGFGDMCRRLGLVGASKFCAGTTVFPLLLGYFVSVAVLMAFPSQLVAAGTPINTVLCCLCMVEVAMVVTQPVVYVAVWNNYYMF